MKVNRTTCWATLILSIAMAVTPVNELAGQEPSQVDYWARSTPVSQSLLDVELGSGGLISGQVVNSDGQPLAHQSITIQQAGREPIVGKSDESGRFSVAGVKAGVCKITCGEQVAACRCWAHRTGPPVATQAILLTVGGDTVRGQRPIADLLTGPVLIGLIIAAAVAIPIAVHNAKDDAS